VIVSEENVASFFGSVPVVQFKTVQQFHAQFDLHAGAISNLDRVY